MRLSVLKSRLLLSSAAFLATVVVLAGCNKNDSSSSEPAVNKEEMERKAEPYNNFNGRIVYKDQELEAYEEGTNKRANRSGFQYIADVKPPKFNGRTLSATGIAFRGKYAFVSYHWNGKPDDYAGALEVINVQNPNKPQLVAGLYFNDTDLNEVYVDNNTIYAVGGRSLSSSGYNQQITSGGVVEIIRFLGNKLGAVVIESAVPSFSANSVFRHGKNLYIASGNTGGGVFELGLKPKNFLQVTQSDHYSNSKYGVRANNKYVFLEAGQNPKLHTYKTVNFRPGSKNTRYLPKAITPKDGKNVLQVDGSANKAYVSSGRNGLQVYDLNGNAQPVQSFNTSGPGLVNGVDFDQNYAYAAKGSEGLFILDINNFSNIKVQFRRFTGSANYVKAYRHNVFLAHGRGGLKILKK